MIDNADDPADSTTWLEHVTDEEYLEAGLDELEQEPTSTGSAPRRSSTSPRDVPTTRSPGTPPCG